MKQLKTMTLMKLAFLSLIGVWLIWSGGTISSQTTTTCATCNENYYNCMITMVDVGQCIEDKVQNCRLAGYDEASCENGRPYFEQQCRDDAEQQCVNEYYSCWNTCTINGEPPPPGSAPPPRDIATCTIPYWTYYIDSAGVVHLTLQNADAEPPPSPGSHIFFIDGQQQSSWVPGIEWQIPSAFLDGQQHTIVSEYYFSCSGYSWGTKVVNTTFTLSP
jgi:hypothetical protein